MISENKNKSRLKTTPVVEQTRLPDGQGSLRGKKSKILVLGLVLIILIGILSPALGPVKIARAHGDGSCLINGTFDTVEHTTLANCPISLGTFVPYSEKNPHPKEPREEELSPFSKEVSESRCGFGFWTGGGSIPGCILQIAYYTLYMFGSFLLWLAALLFNFLIDYTIKSELLRSDFIAKAWGTVRDLSNIFFILILLYIAIKIILDFGGSEAKKTIAKVIIIALLINFSMFFTRVIIDSSNILALIFYNKIKPEKTNQDGSKEEALDPNGKKDISGGLTKSFNPATHLDGKFFEKAGDEINLEGLPKEKKVVSIGILIGITVISGLIMILAAYAFFISALSFLGRLIELFILIIFSPFAFMSFTIPLLEKVDYIGWDAWSKRLLKVAFMAPIFMFFLYFIFLLFNGSNAMFSSAVKGDGLWVTLLNLAIPALVILILLMKATKFAKEASGAMGEALIKGAKVVAGVGLGVAGGLAIGGAAKGLQATVGKYSEKLAESETAKRLVKRGVFGADSLQRGAKFLGGRDFDARKGAVGGLLKSAEGVTGLKFGSASKFLLKEGGGYRGDRERAEKKRQERVNKLKVSEDEPLKQDLNKAEEEFYEMNNASSHEIEQIENRLTTAVKNRETYRLEQEAVKGKLSTTKSSLDTFGEEKAKATLDKATSAHKTAQDEADAAESAATTAESTATTDAEKNAAANARIIANTKKEVAVKADRARADANTDYDTIISDPDYIKTKADYDIAEKDYNKAVDDFKIRTQNVKELTDHRSAIKNAKAGGRSVADTGAELKKAEDRLSVAEKVVERAEARFAAAVGTAGEATAKRLLDIAKRATESRKQVKEIANAVNASAQYGNGQSINNYEDKILPELREKIEDENRERLINYAKRNVRGSADGVINALRTMVTTAGDDQASRNAAAHKIIEEASKKKI